MKSRGATINRENMPASAPAENPAPTTASAPSPASTIEITYSTLMILVVMKLLNEKSNRDDTKPAASCAFTGETYRAGAGAAAWAIPVVIPQAAQAAAPGVNWPPHCEQNAIALIAYTVVRGKV